MNMDIIKKYALNLVFTGLGFFAGVLVGSQLQTVNFEHFDALPSLEISPSHFNSPRNSIHDEF